MAGEQEQYDFHSVLDDVWEYLVDELELDPLFKELEKDMVFRRSELRDLQERHHTTTDKVHALLQLVRDRDFIKYGEFKQCLSASGQKHLTEKLEAAERGEYNPIVTKEPRTEEEKLQDDTTVVPQPLPELLHRGKACFTSALIVYYIANESTMPVAPLVEEHDVEMTSFYVRPPMMAYKKPNAFGQVKQSTEQEKTKISSYRELLFSDNGTYRKIYLTADAGMGKTSFSKMLARTWCQAHKPDKDVAEKFRTDDLDTMKTFDFLFLIKLREYQGKKICSLDNMIMTMLRSKLQMASSFTKTFVEQVLYSKRCFIIVDGLDEWSHPEHTGSQALSAEVIPHTTHLPGSCCVLTTTRPWKLSAAKLSAKDIDRQVEILELDDDSALQLELLAIELLNQIQDQAAANSNTKAVTDFESRVPETIIGNILNIPFVLLHMICLWFGDSDIGKSLCEVYSNIIELTLTRWLIKTDSGHTDCKCELSKEHENIKLQCMEKNRHCQSHMLLLLKIGELAFSTLLNDIGEELLLFDKEQVLRVKYLSEKELEQILKMGLLSQIKDKACLAAVRLQLYFPHKTLHEFFCALFIATNWNTTDSGTMSIKQTISNKCTSVYDILEMSEVFVFVCGLNPEVYSDIALHLAAIVDTDQSVIEYRNGVEEDSDLLEYYQRIQISCFLESFRNKHPECKVVIEDMVIDRDASYGRMEKDAKDALEKILSNSASCMKSLKYVGSNNAEYLHLSEEMVRTFEQTDCPCLGTLILAKSEQTLCQSILITTAHTLKYLKLEQMSLRYSTLTLTLPLLTKFTLDSCNLGDSTVSLTLPLLTEFTLDTCELTNSTVTLTLLLLTEFTLDTCDLRNSTVTLTLPLLTEFTLDTCNLRDSTVTLTLPRLTEFTLKDCDLRDSTVPLTLPQLTEFTLKDCDLRDITVPLTLPLVTEFTLDTCDLRHSTVTLTLPLLTEITLETCDLRHSTITLTLLLLTEFTLDTCDLRDSTVILSQEMTSLETITLEETTVNKPCCRELFLSISKLPQPITVKLLGIIMTAEEWRELLFDILGKLPKSIHVEMQVCVGPSEREWRYIVDDMKATPALCVTDTDLYFFGASISFDTVVV